ncbi:hypothetical protein ACFLU5_07330 [Bacteroidota bacterium]
MDRIRKSAKRQKGFYLNKWFLDCVSDEGEAMIFYAAILKWRGWEVPYTSMLYYDQATGVTHRSRFHKIHLPEKNDRSLYWNDLRFGIAGKWEALASPIQARIFESDEGYVDWNCFQPASNVHLKIKDRVINGKGYAEQLVLTVEPWKLPMKELRWGRYGSQEDRMVWIELKDEGKQQWLWYNGEKIENANIGEDQITISAKGISLELDRSVVLESERKIQQVVKNLIRYLPGFNSSMPLRFLMADEFKWFDHGIMRKEGEVVGKGWAIHEFVDFNRHSE